MLSIQPTPSLDYELKKLSNDTSSIKEQPTPDLVQPLAKVSAVSSIISTIVLTSLKVRETCQRLLEKHGVHSTITMKSAGFRYTGEQDAACCDQCHLKVTGWTSEMDPFTVHKKSSPTCPFVRSMIPNAIAPTPLSSALAAIISATTSNEQLPNRLVEVDLLQAIRRRTFSHWPRTTSVSSAQVMEAGFFNCNVGDRVICLYCNIICQQWTPHSDDPWELHRTLSPKCPYVVAVLASQQAASIRTVNEQSTHSNSASQCDEMVHATACHANYVEIPRRYASFTAWPTENLPSVDDLVKAGFFFTGTKTIVTCFYCNGSLEDLRSKDNPIIEHARWFPHCAYAKQLCGAELYRMIVESMRTQEGLPLSSRMDDDDSNNGQLIISEEDPLSEYVAARLHLPISQRLLDQNFKLTIIQRCLEYQLKFKGTDFVSDGDLLVACIIAQKQDQYINEITRPGEINHPNTILQNHCVSCFAQHEIPTDIPRSDHVICMSCQPRLRPYPVLTT